MALGARLELRQGQSLVITPQLQQAIKLLQLSNLELEAYVEAEIERNPLLARDERDAEPDRETPAAEAPLSDALSNEIPGGRAEADMDARHDDLYARRLARRPGHGGRGGGCAGGDLGPCRRMGAGRWTGPRPIAAARSTLTARAWTAASPRNAP